MNKDRLVKTHRCKGSLERRLSIRYDNNKKVWRVCRHMNDWDYDSDYHYLEKIMEIEYCPFCGKKLEE